MAFSENLSSIVSGTFIHIISNNQLQNELLLSFLKNKTGISGDCLDQIDEKRIFNTKGATDHIFLLIDCKNVEMKTLWGRIKALRDGHPSRIFVALCNVDSRAKIEKTAMDNGIKGIFYDNDPAEIIPKGIYAILNGDLWYSRKTLTKYLLESKPAEEPANSCVSENVLTARERELLLFFASGYDSREISEKLCISIHTVKTHIYNIYSKINVNNRLQATLWAAKYLNSA